MKIIRLSKHLLHLQVVRYFISAGTATFVDLGTFFVTYNYVLHKQDLPLGSYIMAGPTASLILSSTVGLITNFLITKYFVFTKSNIKGHVQFLRYVSVALLVILANYALMTALIKMLHWYPTIARGFSAITIGVMSFTIHRVFSFQIKSDEES